MKIKEDADGFYIVDDRGDFVAGHWRSRPEAELGLKIAKNRNMKSVKIYSK